MGGKDQEGPPMGNHNKEIMFIFYYKYCRKYSLHVKKFAFGAGTENLWDSLIP